MNKKTISIIGLILAAVFLFFGFYIKVPEKRISLYGSADDGGYREYVGGDAYNIQIEASLRAGEIAGARSMKAVMFAAAGIIAIISLFGLHEEDDHISYQIRQNLDEMNRTIKEIQKEFEKYAEDQQSKQEPSEPADQTSKQESEAEEDQLPDL